MCAGTEMRLGMCSSDSKCRDKRGDVDRVDNSGLLENRGSLSCRISGCCREQGRGKLSVVESS